MQHDKQVSDQKPFRLLKQYPLLCGLFTFALEMRAQRLGGLFANAWGSIMYAGHLYNAVRQEKLLAEPWTDMELLIAQQTPEAFFVGNSPKEPCQYLECFLLSMGYQWDEGASNSAGATPDSEPEAARLTEKCRVGGLLAEKYCDMEDPAVSWTRESIKLITESTMDDTKGGTERDSSQANLTVTEQEAGKAEEPATESITKNVKENQYSTTALDFLNHLANALNAETPALSMDYLSLHRSSWALLD